jgi:hypothetical protein
MTELFLVFFLKNKKHSTTHSQKKNHGTTLKLMFLNILFYLRACLGISGMKGNEGHWGGGISIITQNFPKSPSILFHPLQSSISQTSPK